MNKTLSTAFLLCLLFRLNTGFGQVDTAKKFVENENSLADKKLKKEIQQHQLLQKPVPLPAKSKVTTAQQVTGDKKKIQKREHRKKKRNASK